ncbi:endonuclease/exonuclease/phosphatase family protein [Echinimonas agarilytica]|uniref:Endonuclease/exonuclease/phosphatase family protein n=1 Tax=Echinimonas agarilytica TaxID=1215918 RepID=A0AA42B8B2_9GAMM|nr:endonuclease/exonuclease/phosphatase family protein [Echinimonas agarilytica]MCM2681025.1 endonuclease/exonuclease/phosphatase family protein [Echinimonas agarilytica]
MTIALSLFAIGTLSLPWQIPEHKQVVDRQEQFVAGECLDGVEVVAASAHNVLESEFSVLSWNVYKQQRNNVIAELNQYATTTDLLLLQEVVSQSTLFSTLPVDQWHWVQARAFTVSQSVIGVASLSRYEAIGTCGFWRTEPWILFPKTALLTIYALPEGESLWVINIHAINFALGLEDYNAQLNDIVRVASTHHGPMIWAGDFNTWREGRQQALDEALSQLNLQPIAFRPDVRSEIFGYALDHVFYRKLNIVEAKSTASDASDHNPIWVNFTSQKNP